MSNLFISERERPHLFYKHSPAPNMGNLNGAPATSISLCADFVPARAEIPFDDLFEETDVSPVRSNPHALNLAVNMMRNQIAFETRRGVGNILWVPNHDIQVWFENSNIYPFDEYIIDREMPPNELRCAYWKIVGNVPGDPVKIGAVDGGIQFSPQGFHALDNYKAYFRRCFWN